MNVCRTGTIGGMLVSVVFAMTLAFVGQNQLQAQPWAAADRQRDRTDFWFLLDHRNEISREVIELPDGVETRTESDNPEVVEVLQRHVEAMHTRLKDGSPIHMRDPLFRAIFRRADRIEMTVEKTEKGVRVTETSKDPEVVLLIQAHAEVLNLFLANGHTEVRKNHVVPTAK